MNGNPSTAWQKAVNYALLWKVALLKLAIRCSITALTFYLAAMGNTRWAELDADSRVKLFIGIGVNVLTLVSTFLDKSEKSLAAGDYAPPDDGNTTIIQRKTTQTDTLQTSSTAPVTTQPAPPKSQGGV